MEITSRDSQRRGESPESSVNSRHLHNISTSSDYTCWSKCFNRLLEI
jgi:hypothetical protein